MSKILKRVAALLLAVALMLPGFSQALANPGNLSGHPAPTERGSITIHLREGTESANHATGGVPIANVPIRIVRVTLNTPNVPPTQAQMRDPLWIAANTTETSDYFEMLTNTNGVAQFLNLPQGIWAVSQLDTLNGVSNPIADINDRFVQFLVGIPTHIPGSTSGYNGGPYRLDVVVFPKFAREILEDPEKEIIDFYGNVATWEFGVNIPTTIESAVHLSIVDILPSELRFRPGTVTGTFTTAPAYTETRGTLTLGTHFTVATGTVGGREAIQISMTAAGFQHLADYGLLGTGRLTFRFETGFSGDAADLGTIQNEGYWIFNPNPNYLFDVTNPPACPPTHPYYDTNCIPGIPVEEEFVALALNILKLSVGARQPLAGAHFALYREARIGETGTAFTIDGTVRHLIPVRDTSGAPTLADRPMVGITDANGRLQFNGVNSSEVVGNRFWLRETQAPAGYRVINEWMQISVTPANTGDRDANNNILVGTGYVVPVNVYNELQGGWNLPATGGIGTIILTVVGLVLVGGALVLFVGSKKDEEVA